MPRLAPVSSGPRSVMSTWTDTVSAVIGRFVGSGVGCDVGSGVVGSGVVGSGVGSRHTASASAGHFPGSEETQSEVLVLPQHE